MWTLQSQVKGRKDQPALVMLHSLGSSHVMWDECVDLLLDHFRIILLDLPGHGGSAPVAMNVPLTMDALVDAIERTLSELGVERFHFVGLSIGGMVTCAVAQRWGVGEEPRLMSATTMASGAKNGTPDMWVERAALIRAEGTEAVVEATMERWFSPSFTQSHPDAVARIREAFLGCDSEGYAQCCEVLESTDLRLGMERIRVPFSVVNGSEDAGFGDQPASALAATAVNAPWTQTTHIEGARHMCAMEQPERAVAAILAAAAAGR